MATTAAPYGAVPIGTLSSGGSLAGKVRAIGIAASYGTALFYGDFLKAVTGGVVEKDTGTTTLTPVGIFLGCSYTDPLTGQFRNDNQWPASNAATDAVAYVLDDPHVVLKMQADEAIAVTGRWANVAVVQTGGSVKFGMSRNAVDGGSIANTSGLPLKVIDFIDGPDSAVGDTYTDVVVIFNGDHEYLSDTGLS